MKRIRRKIKKEKITKLPILGQCDKFSASLIDIRRRLEYTVGFIPDKMTLFKFHERYRDLLESNHRVRAFIDVLVACQLNDIMADRLKVRPSIISSGIKLCMGYILKKYPKEFIECVVIPKQKGIRPISDTDAFKYFECLEDNTGYTLRDELSQPLNAEEEDKLNWTCIGDLDEEN